MMEREIRCEHPHPRLPGKPCNALIRASATGGLVGISCWRCHELVFIDFEPAGTTLTGITV